MRLRERRLQQPSAWTRAKPAVICTRCHSAAQDKYLAVVKECFQTHSNMHKALKDAFEMFCNKSVAGSATPELLANFCDLLLSRKGPEKLSDEEIDRQLEKVAKLLNYINERDLFGCAAEPLPSVLHIWSVVATR